MIAVLSLATAHTMGISVDLPTDFNETFKASTAELSFARHRSKK